jgi:Uma2 family endonuclease
MNAQVQVERFKLTVDNYHRMIEAGIFGPDDRLELIEGDLITKVPPKPEHADYVSYLDRTLTLTLGMRWYVRAQSPITLPEHSEPEPDITLVAPKRYLEHHPNPEDIRLIIEVSDSSLTKDREIKLPLYARYKIPEVRIVDVAGHAVECYWDPKDGRYSQSNRTSRGMMVSPIQSEVTVDLDALWQSR